MKKIALLFAACCAGFAGHAQISITGGSLTYTQNFDALDTAVYSTGNPGSANLPSGWAVFEYGTSTTRANNLYVGENGASNTGDTYSYGTLGTTERALGSLASGSVASHYGAKFVNNTGAPITGFAIRYRGEQWRMGSTGRTNMDSLRFYYSTTATGVSDTTSSSYTLDNGLTLTTPNMSATGGALDGNLSTNSTYKTGIVSTTIPVGGTLVIKWIDPNVLGSDDGLAIDSFTVAFTLGGPASPRPNIFPAAPTANQTGVSTATNLVLAFDKAVVKGTGNIYLKNRTTQATTTIAASSANVLLGAGGYIATVSGLSLQNNTTYHVTVDSTAFDTASFHSVGIYDTTYWKFTTGSSGIASVKTATLPLTVVNPAANGSIVLSCNVAQSAVLTAHVYDLNGREVMVQSLNATKGDNRFALHASLPAGNYIIRVDDGKEWGSVKVTMQ